MKHMRIESPSHGRGEVWIDGVKQEGVTSVSLSIKVGEANKITLGRLDDRVITQQIVGKLDVEFCDWEAIESLCLIDPFEPLIDRMARDALETVEEFVAHRARLALETIRGDFMGVKRMINRRFERAMRWPHIPESYYPQH